MGRDLCKLIRLLILLLFISNSWISETRTLSPRGSTKSISKGIEIFIGGLYIEGIKTGGPSAGGEGHAFNNAETLGARKAGGPSDGVGHKFPNAVIYGRKSGGPSAGGIGHAFTNSKILGTHPQSGPSPGEGH